MIKRGMLSKNFICGIDEAGRGCLAGPVCAAAVVLPENFDFSILNDSKKLSEKKRFAAMDAIYRGAVTWRIGWATNAEIDSMNILQASLLAMSRAYTNAAARFADRAFLLCSEARAHLDVVIDGPFAPALDCASCRAVIKADATIHAVMAASILAKTARDKIMCRYAELYPGYGYEKHKGYGTREHAAALAKLGPSPIQRLSFNLKERKI